MTDNMQTIRDDLAYMRSMAQEGRRAPLLGGAILAAAGAIFGVASLAHWALFTGLIQASDWAFLVVWLGATALFLTALVVLTNRLKSRPGATSASNRAFGATWAALGFAIFVLFICIFVAAWRLETNTVMLLFAPVILTLYGAGWSVSAEMSDRRWIRLVSLGSFAAAIVMALLIGRNEQMLAYAGALFLLVMAPGLALMRGEPSEVV